MGMATPTPGPSTAPIGNNDIDFSFLPGNVPVPQERDDHKPKRRKRAGSRQKTAEQLYAALIKTGEVRVVRRKGKPPLIEWL